MQKVAASFLLLLAAAPVQADTTALASYKNAMATLQRGLEAHGGVTALRGIATVRREITTDWIGSGQGPEPEPFEGPTTRLPHVNEHRVGFDFADFKGNRWLDTLEASDDFDTVTQVNAGTPDKGFSSVVVHQEPPFVSELGADAIPATRVRRFRHYPEQLLLAALDRPESLRSIGPDVITFADPLGNQVTLYFDPKTHRLTKSEMLREHALAGDTTSEILYRDYRRVENVMLPFETIDRVAGVPVETTRVSRITLNTTMPDERLEPPRSFVRIESNADEPRVESLSNNVYVIYGPYNIMFARFRDFIAVFEAPLNSRYAAQCLELIRKTIPSVPIRFVVATHFHFDHVAGLRPFVAEGSEVLTTVDAGRTIERVLASKRSMHPDGFGSFNGGLKLASTQKRVIDDGGNRVEIYDIGPTLHAKHILVAYFPAIKTLFEADVFDPVSTENVVAGYDAMLLAKKIHELGLDVERIIPVHGIPVTMKDLERGVTVRNRQDSNRASRRP